MAEYTVTPAAERQPPVTAMLIVYILFGAAAVLQIASSGVAVPAPLLTLVGIVGVIIAYVTRGDLRGTWAESHLRTFWWSLLWAMLGGLVLVTLGLILIGIPIAYAIWAVDTIWVIYRVIRGYLLFHDSKPVPGM